MLVGLLVEYGQRYGVINNEKVIMPEIEICMSFFECNKLEEALKLLTKEGIKEVKTICGKCKGYKPVTVGGHNR